MRLSLGGFSQVIMTDRWFSELRAGRAFGLRAAKGAVAGENGHVQVKNPAGSGKQVLIAELRVNLGAAGYVQVAAYDTDCTTDVGAVPCLLLGGTAGVSHIRSQGNAGILGTTLTTRYLAINTPTVIYPSWGPELSPGRGLAVVAATLNVQIDLEVLLNEV